MLGRKEPPVPPEELRGAILLLMNIDDNVDRIRQEVVDDDEGEKEEPE